MKSHEISKSMAKLNREIVPLVAKMRDLEREYSAARSREWIAAHGVTLKDVQRSSWDGAPWFGHIRSYADWLASNSTKRWAEWNGRLHSVAELTAGKWDPDAPGMIEHVPTAEDAP